jgi:hypothetical protein
MRLVFGITFFLILVSTKATSQKLYQLDTGVVAVDYVDTLRFNKFFNADFEKFMGKKVSKLLKWIGKEYKRQYFYQAKAGYANFLRTSFSDKLVIDIYVSEYKHMEPLDKEFKWNMRKFKLERVGEIKLRYNRVCIKGCDPEEVDR